MIDREYNEICVSVPARFSGTRLRGKGIAIHQEKDASYKLGITTVISNFGNMITPSVIEYEYKLMFEERTILLNTYDIETLLAEKAQTIISRGLANTRMRDFYDLYEITGNKEFSWSIESDAFKATCKKRKTILLASKATGHIIIQFFG